MSKETIVCRAWLPGVGCYGGSSRARGTMAEDGTYDGASIVCDACYVALMPLTPSGQGLLAELPAAITAYRARYT